MFPVDAEGRGPWDKLKAVICLIYDFAGGNVTSYQLAKILYLLDYLSLRSGGGALLGLTYVYHHYGPYPRDAIAELEKEGFLYKEPTLSARGLRTVLRKPTYKCSWDFTPQEIALIYCTTKAVKSKTKNSVNDLNEIIYNTEPMRTARKGQVLNMNLAYARYQIQQVKERMKRQGPKRPDVFSVLGELPCYIKFDFDQDDQEFLEETLFLLSQEPVG